jgi:excisionase family DNA binding protein
VELNVETMLFHCGADLKRTIHTNHNRQVLQKTIFSTADVARLFNVTETTVKRWADEGKLKCQKTPGGHRKFEIRNVIEFAEKNNFEPVGALEFPSRDTSGSTTEIAVLTRDYAAMSNVFVDKALSPDRTDLFQFLSFLYEHHIQLWEIYDLVIRPGMCDIGERWANGKIGISHEHHASYETLDALAKLQTEILIKSSTGWSALFACVGDELHEIGLRCASYVVESEGWAIHYLGANTPAEAVISAVRDLKPTLVCLSCTRKEHSHQDVERLREIVVAAHAAGSQCVIGGAGAGGNAEGFRIFDGVLCSAKEVVEYLEGFGRSNPLQGPQN